MNLQPEAFVRSRFLHWLLTHDVFIVLGLWMADLCITQIMQETIPETERGVVFGVQSALNETFSMLKDVMVMLLPDPPTFGICIIVSWLAICLSLFSFFRFSRQVRRHSALSSHKQLQSP